MLTIKALTDGSEGSLPCLGTLCPLENEPSDTVCLTKRITVDNIGAYTKKLVTPLYKKGVMSRLSVTDPSRSFDPTHCLGVLCRSISIRPKGYVVRLSGAHRFCLPVYETQSLSSYFYSIAGYMVTTDGFVAVAKRRTLLWATAGFLLGTAVVLSYLIFQYGAEGALEELARFGSSLLQ
ncbi:MAG: hypothetical protein RSF82_06045 [Angelakisella sp.]